MAGKIGLILGSGWGKIITDIQNAQPTSFKDVFNRETGVPGHEGKVIFGQLEGKDVIVMSGRFHTYEGYSSEQVAETVTYLHKQGVNRLIVTSASGGLNPKYKVGDLVIQNDLITLFAQSPLVGAQFQNMSEPFDESLRQKAIEAAVGSGLSFQQGVYVYFRGPHFETFADKLALRSLGGDICGMSTVPEVIMANHLGMKVLGLSLVTNLAFVKHDHKEVLAAAQSKENQLKEFFTLLLKDL